MDDLVTLAKDFGAPTLIAVLVILRLEAKLEKLIATIEDAHHRLPCLLSSGAGPISTSMPPSEPILGPLPGKPIS